MPEPVVFVDTETTGLEPDYHEVWEAAVVYLEPDPEPHWMAIEFRFPPINLERADPGALRVNAFYDRHPVAPGPHIRYSDGRRGNSQAWQSEDPDRLARILARMLAGKHLVANVPGFDAAFLDRLLRRHRQAPAWHYHLIDVEALAIGYLRGLNSKDVRLPWDSEAVSKQLDINPEWFDRHTALGDALWAAHMYTAIVHGRNFDFGNNPAAGYTYSYGVHQRG